MLFADSVGAADRREERMKMECCAAAQGTDWTVLARAVRAVALTAWRAVTLPYADTIGTAIFTLTFLWVLVSRKGTPISSSQGSPDVTVRRAA
jgi:uncharacterized protein (DUF3084 family)